MRACGEKEGYWFLGDLNGPEIHRKTDDILLVACSLNVQSNVRRSSEIMPLVIEGEIAPPRFLGH